MAIDWYQPLDLPAEPIAAARTCLDADPPRPPGNSDEFYAAANRLGLTAQALRDALAVLAGIAANDSVWTGDAAQQFKDILKDPQRTRLDLVPDRYDGYAAALRGYAATLDGHQLSIDSARAAVQSALDGYNRVVAATPDPKLLTPTFAGPVDSDPRHGAARQDCLAAARQFQTAYNTWIDAAARCQHAIKRVDSDKLHNPHGMDAAGHALNGAIHEFVDLTAKLADAVAKVAAVLAVLTLPWPPLALFFMAASTIASAVQAVADADRRFQYGEHVTAMDLAFDALGAIPVAKPGRQAVEAGRALKTAGLLTKTRAGGAAFAKSLRSEVVKTYWDEIGERVVGLKKVTWRPNLQQAGSTLGEIGDAQNAVVAGAQAGTHAYDNRKRGLRAMQRSAFEVVVGPLAPVPVAVLAHAGGLAPTGPAGGRP